MVVWPLLQSEVRCFFVSWMFKLFQRKVRCFFVSSMFFSSFYFQKCLKLTVYPVLDPYSCREVLDRTIRKKVKPFREKDFISLFSVELLFYCILSDHLFIFQIGIHECLSLWGGCCCYRLNVSLLLMISFPDISRNSAAARIPFCSINFFT